MVLEKGQRPRAPPEHAPKVSRKGRIDSMSKSILQLGKTFILYHSRCFQGSLCLEMWLPSQQLIDQRLESVRQHIISQTHFQDICPKGEHECFHFLSLRWPGAGNAQCVSGHKLLSPHDARRRPELWPSHLKNIRRKCPLDKQGSMLSKKKSRGLLHLMAKWSFWAKSSTGRLEIRQRWR